MIDRGGGFLDERQIGANAEFKCIYRSTAKVLEMKQGLCRWNTDTRLSCAFGVRILLSLTANPNLVANNLDRQSPP